MRGWAGLSTFGDEVRASPFVPFFGLGVLFGWLGISPWITYALGLSEVYSGAQHATLQLQCFELAFAAGFLFTALPRRTSSPPASLATLASTAVLLLATAAASLADRPELASRGYLATLVVLFTFAARRLLPGAGIAKRPPPACFVLIPLGLFHGVAGAILTGDFFEGSLAATELGLDLIRQGVFFCLVLGVGGLILPLALGHPPPPDLTLARATSATSGAGRAAILVPALLGLAIGATIVVEHALGMREIATLRGLVVAAGLVVIAGAHRPPRAPGLQRRVVWIAAWFVPLGPIAAGLAPDYRVAFLHLTFVGGFGLVTFAIASHVALGHTGREGLRDSVRWPVIIYSACMLLAAATRVSSDFLVDSYFRHLAYAASVWILGSMAWVWLVLPVRRVS